MPERCTHSLRSGCGTVHLDRWITIGGRQAEAIMARGDLFNRSLLIVAAALSTTDPHPHPSASLISPQGLISRTQPCDPLGSPRLYIPNAAYLRRAPTMYGPDDDAWSPRPSDVSSYPSSSHASDADDELDDIMSQAGTAEREESSRGSGSGRNSPSLSVYSYHSSIDGGALLREIHGRTFNNTSDVS